jgi:hypothetical protein
MPAELARADISASIVVAEVDDFTEITLIWEPLVAARLARAGGGWRTTEAERHCDP